MGLKIFFATFWLVLCAELADKTQLVGIGMSAKTGRPFLVWLASVLAYMVVTLFSVFIGAFLAKYLKPDFIRYFSAGAFIILGILMLFKII